MISSFPLDLKTARRASGLTQSDCAHLLDSHRSKVSHLECGETLPSLRDICVLSLIYDTSFESLFNLLMDETLGEMRERLGSIPPAPKDWRGTSTRRATLNRLRTRLDASNTLGYDAG